MVRRGGPGAQCSPRSSAAGSWSTGLRSSCFYHAPSTVVKLGALVSCRQFIDLVDTAYFAFAIAACATIQLFHFVGWLFDARSVRCLGVHLLTHLTLGVCLLLVLLAAGVCWLYGGEADEAIRYMEPEPMPEPSASHAADRQRALEVLQAIVGVDSASYFGTDGHKKKQFGVQLWVHPPERERRKIRVACAADKPTMLDAAREARRQVVNQLGVAAVEAAERLVTERHTAAGPSGVEQTVNAVLGKTQQLKAVVLGAEKRAHAAEQAATRAEAEAAEAAAAIVREPEET